MITDCGTLVAGGHLELRAKIDSVWLKIPANSSVDISTGLRVKIPGDCIGEIRPLASLSVCGLEVELKTLPPKCQCEVHVTIHNKNNIEQNIKIYEKIAELHVLRKE